MEKLVFACPWNKSKELSWSGTHYALYCALAKYYDIIDFDTSGNKIDSIDIFLYRFIKKMTELLGWKTYDMELWRYHMAERKMKKEKKLEEFPIFQFDASPLSKTRKSYIYIDLNYGFLDELYIKDQETYRSCNFNMVSHEYLVQRTEYQNEYFMHAKGIFTMGRWLAEELVSHYNLPKSKVHWVGGGCNVDVKLISPKEKDNNKILFIGRDFDRKNGGLTVEAFLRVKQVMPEAQLYIAGTNDLELEQEGIHLLGDLKTEQLAYYYNICDIFCMPSKFEAYGLVFIEALIYGLPCIGRNAYEMPYFIQDGETGYLLEHDNSEELAELMLDLLHNSKIKRNVMQNRQKYIDEYSWDTVAKRITAVIGKGD